MAAAIATGRAERYYVEGDFERDIENRSSIPSRLEAELPNVRERGMIAFGSGVTDPYQPLEREQDITGRCARILADSPRALPALVMTKSSLALRDLSFWSQLNRRAGFVLLVSLTSLDEGAPGNNGTWRFQLRRKAFHDTGV